MYGIALALQVTLPDNSTKFGQCFETGIAQRPKECSLRAKLQVKAPGPGRKVYFWVR